ncbi:MAG: AEC family transporter [Clostridiales Family XIII bacterium]|jgi:predicted permease|nr:AEC family transporter [Clostridiales Family XIII bacterium]
MLNGLASVAVIFLIFAVGFYLTYRRVWPDNATTTLSTLVVTFAAPALAIVSIADRFKPEMIRESLLLLIISLIHVALLYVSGKLLSRVLRLSSGRKTIFQVTFTFSNVIFIGLPINEIVFGHDGLPTLFTYYIITLILFWSLGAFEIANASPNHETGISVKKIFSPGLIGVIIGAIIAELELPIPMIFDTALRYVSSLCVPLSLLVIGANLVVLTKIGLQKPALDEVVIMLGKFLISPIFMFILLKLFHVDGMPFAVLMLTSTMPCHMQTSILAQYYNVESEYASKLVGMSTLICLVTIPAYVTLIGYLQV